MNSQLLILVSLIIPIIGIIFISLFKEKSNCREASTLLAAIALIFCTYSLLPNILEGVRPELVLFSITNNLAIHFKVEPFGMLFACIASFLWLINSIYSIGYMRSNNEKNQTRFYIFFALAITSTMGIAFSANLFTLFIFYEFLTLSTYPLVTHKGSDKAKRSGRIYLGILLTSSICLFLPAIIWTYNLADTIEFTNNGIFNESYEPIIITSLLLIFVYGIGKAALMPIHYWLPSAMVAPTPVSALLHAVAVVKAGVFSIVKIIIYIFIPTLLSETNNINFLLYLAGITIIIASIIALRSDNLKRRLAYSTISQLSYVILATALLVPISIMGAIFHILAHAFGKITLFFAAGAIYTATKKTEISQLNGIGRTMPLTMLAFAIGSLSMIGVPPTAGFLSKWFILQGALEIQSWFAISVIIISTILNAAYFLPIIYAAFFLTPNAKSQHSYNEAPVLILTALLFTALITIILFFFPQVPMQLIGLLIGVSL